MRRIEDLIKSPVGEALIRLKAVWIGDLSGAFADLGTFLPLVIGILVIGHLDPTGLLIGFGLFAIATGLIYRLPIPVQPMKVIAALAIAGGLSAPAMIASGLLLGCILVLLGVSGAIGRLRRLVPRTVMVGIQIGLGLHLLLASADLAKDAIAIGLLAFATLILIHATPLRSLGCLVLVVGGTAWALATGHAAWPTLTATWHMPTLALPAWDAFREAAETAFWPQLALTLTNAVLLTSALAGEYFPDAGERTSARQLALSTGILNLSLAPIGAMPMCHGAGGLAAQYHQGARSGLAPIIFGGMCLALGFLAGPAALDWLLIVPLPVVAALLAYAAIHLMRPGRLTHVTSVCLVVIGITAIVSVLVSLSAGLVAGMLAELARSALSKPDRRST